MPHRLVATWFVSRRCRLVQTCQTTCDDDGRNAGQGTGKKKVHVERREVLRVAGGSVMAFTSNYTPSLFLLTILAILPLFQVLSDRSHVCAGDPSHSLSISPELSETFRPYRWMFGDSAVFCKSREGSGHAEHCIFEMLLCTKTAV
jgi:hypothetical protein